MNLPLPPDIHSGAFVRLDGGRVLWGIGPFSEAAEPPGEGVAFYINSFDLSDPLPWKIPARVEETSSPVGRVTKEVDISWEAPAPDSFAQVFSEMMAEIEAGRLAKTVPALAESGVLHRPGDVAELMVRCLEASPKLYPYGFWAGGEGFCGVTPEYLFIQEGRTLETMALAGTARPEDENVFIHDSKEIREHEIVAGTLMSRLAPYGRLTRSPRGILNLDTLIHMYSSIHLETRDAKSPGFWINLLHPTPALGSKPRTPETLRQLQEWRDRMLCPRQFGAPFGISVDGKAILLVAIRSLHWEGDHIALTAGCGVVRGSGLIHEWRELALKRRTILHSLGL